MCWRLGSLIPFQHGHEKVFLLTTQPLTRWIHSPLVNVEAYVRRPPKLSPNGSSCSRCSNYHMVDMCLSLPRPQSSR